VERVQLEKDVFVKWVGFLVWGLDHLQLVSQNISKHLETYQNIPKHTKTYQNIPKHTKTYQKVAEEEAFRNEAQVVLFGVFGGRFFCFHFGLLFVGEA
jgi:hypothetical protein